MLISASAAGVVAAGVTGCAPAVPPRHADAGPAVIPVTGEWRDVARAVDHAVGEAEAAVVGTRIRPEEKRFELRTAQGQPGWLVATRDIGLEIPDDQPGPIRLEAYFEPFGDPPRERALLRAVQRRLERLAGREWAPR